MSTTATTTPEPTCPACTSPDVLHRGGPRRQCARCRWRFEIKADGTTTGLLERWVQSRKRRGHRR